MQPEILNRLVTLTTNFTSTIAGRIDAAISTRASQTSVDTVDTVVDSIKTTVDANLDAPISGISGGLSPPITSGLVRLTANADLDAIRQAAGKDLLNSNTEAQATVSTWTTLVEVASGAGIIEFLDVWQEANASNMNVQARLSVDGNVVWTSATNAWQGTGDADQGFSLVGAADQSLDVVTFGILPFTTSFKLEFQITEASNSVTMGTHYRYYVTG
jgi:hypothetical protein